MHGLCGLRMCSPAMVNKTHSCIPYSHECVYDGVSLIRRTSCFVSVLLELILVCDAFIPKARLKCVWSLAVLPFPVISNLIFPRDAWVSYLFVPQFQSSYGVAYVFVIVAVTLSFRRLVTSACGGL